VAGHPELPDDPRFATNVDRLRNRVELIATLNGITRQRTLDEWSAVLEPVGVPCGPINSIDRVFADPHVAARGMITEFDLPGDNPKVAIVGNPIKFTETPGGFHRRPPLLGEHTEEILQQFGIRRR